MQEILTPSPRPRGLIVVSLLLTIQGISFLVFAVLIFALGVITVRNAVAGHKPTAAALTTAFAALGGGFFLITGLLVFVLTLFMWKQRGWAFWVTVAIEGFVLLISLVLLCGGIIWFLISEGVLAAAILACLFANRQLRATLRR